MTLEGDYEEHNPNPRYFFLKIKGIVWFFNGITEVKGFYSVNEKKLKNNGICENKFRIDT